MKRLQLFVFTLLLIGFWSTNNVYAQEEKKEIDHSYKPMTLKMSEDGSKYIRFITWHQFWLTSQNLSDNNADFKVSPSIRRSRLLWFAQVSPKFMILMHMGLNGLNSSNMTITGVQGNGPQMFLHDAWGEYKLNDALYVGGGLHYWKGMNRLANSSTLNFMTLDATTPFVGWHSLGQTDQFARHMGVYFKGQAGKFDYRLAFNDALRGNLQAGNGIAALNGGNTLYNSNNLYGDTKGGLVMEGYFRYQLWDKESTKLPFAVGTYLGKKKIFNLGVGFFAQPNGSIRLNNTSNPVDETLSGTALYNALDSQTSTESVSHFAVDAFYEAPAGEGALNAYATFMSFNYGENFTYQNGSGSLDVGTGNVLYGHVGYLLPGKKVMPYVAFQNRSYDGHTDNGSTFDLGLNYYVNGHFAKITLEYHSVKWGNREQDLSQLRLQSMIFL